MFKGWYIEATLDTKISEMFTVNEDITLYAKWEPLSEVTIDDFGRSIILFENERYKDYNFDIVTPQN